MMFGALAARFDDVAREPRFDQARNKLGKWALTPSKLINDTSVWTSMADTARVLTLSGSLVDGQYRFLARANAPMPGRAGDSRHVIRLRRLGESEFDWFTAVDHDIGGIHATEVASVVRSLLASAEGRSEADLRSDYRAAFPRASQALGSLLALDTLRTTPLGDGTTAITLGIRIDPDRLRKTAP